MWPFNRNQSNNTSAPEMPPELNDYYQAEKRQRSATTWGLGIATLAVGALLLFGVFTGVKWFIGRVQDNPSEPTQTVQQDETAAPATPSVTNDRDSDKDEEDKSEQLGVGGEVVEPGHTSSTTTSLPNTGPTETLMIFATATTVGGLAHRLTTKNS